jgi:hypothetical protein
MSESKEIEAPPEPIELAFWKPSGKFVMIDIIDPDTGNRIGHKRVPKIIFFNPEINCIQEKLLEGGEEK